MSVELIASYQVCAVFACAICYGDTSWLEQDEEEAIEMWEKSIVSDGGFITIDTSSDGDNTHWGRCDVLGLDGELIWVNHLRTTNAAA